jgi:hypothetical protein
MARVAKELSVLFSFDIPFSLIGGDECLTGFWLEALEDFQRLIVRPQIFDQLSFRDHTFQTFC